MGFQINFIEIVKLIHVASIVEREKEIEEVWRGMERKSARDGEKREKSRQTAKLGDRKRG